METMKWLTMILVLMTVAGARHAAAEDTTEEKRAEIQKYLKMMESFDIDQILNNTRLMTSHMKCIMDEGPCTSQTKDMKKIIPVLVKDSCASCTKEQKKIMKKIMEKFKAIRPNEFEKVSKVFDPEGKYHETFMKNLKDLD